MRFEYIKIDNTGRQIKGSVEARSSKEALENLQSAGHVIASIRESKEINLSTPFILNRNKLVAGFTESLSNMLSAGVPLVEAIDVIAREEKNARLAQIVREVGLKIRKGTSLHESLSTFPIFPPLYVAMVKAGESTGKLKTVLSQMLSHLRKQIEIEEKTTSSLYYPAFLIALSLLTASYLALYVLPQFFTIFEGFDAKLPGITVFVMSSIMFFKKYILLIIAGLAVLGYAFYAYAKSPKGREQIEKTLLFLPGVKDIYGLSLAINFYKPLALLLGNKVNITTSLEVAGTSAQSVLLKNAVNKILTSLKKGKSMAEGMKGFSFFTESAAQMISIGEKSGRLAEVAAGLDEAGSTRLESLIRRLVVLIEPMLILIIGVGIGFLVISALLPVYSLSTMVK